MDWNNYYPNEYTKDLRILTGRSEGALPINTQGHLEICGHYLRKWMEGIDEVLPAANIAAVIYSTALEVLMDEAVYTYFTIHYSNYRKLTRYPKFSGCFHQGYSRNNPFSLCRNIPGNFRLDRIFRYRQRRGHFIRNDERVIEIFEDITGSFFDYQRSLLSTSRNYESLPRYEDIVSKILQDEDVGRNEYGEFVKGVLCENEEFIKSIPIQRSFV